MQADFVALACMSFSVIVVELLYPSTTLRTSKAPAQMHAPTSFAPINAPSSQIKATKVTTVSTVDSEVDNPTVPSDQELWAGCNYVSSGLIHDRCVSETRGRDLPDTAKEEDFRIVYDYLMDSKLYGEDPHQIEAGSPDYSQTQISRQDFEVLKNTDEMVSFRGRASYEDYLADWVTHFDDYTIDKIDELSNVDNDFDLYQMKQNMLESIEQQEFSLTQQFRRGDVLEDDTHTVNSKIYLYEARMSAIEAYEPEDVANIENEEGGT